MYEYVKVWVYIPSIALTVLEFSFLHSWEMLSKSFFCTKERLIRFYFSKMNNKIDAQNIKVLPSQPLLTLNINKHISMTVEY